MEAAFPHVARRSVFTFAPRDEHEGARTAEPSRRRQVSSAEWGGSLDEILSIHHRERTQAPQAGLPASSCPPPPRRHRATAEDFGGSLDQVLVRRQPGGSRDARAPPVATPPEPPRESRALRAAARSAAALEEWGGGLGDVLQQERPRGGGRPPYCEPEHLPRPPPLQQPAHHQSEAQAAAPAPLGRLLAMGFEPAPARAALERERSVDAAVEALLLEQPGSVRPPRGPAVTAQDWGGGLGDVLRPQAQAQAQPRRPAQPRGRAHGHGSGRAGEGLGARNRPSAPAQATELDEYHELMQLHLRDNVEAPLRKAAPDDWREVLRLLKPVRPPPRRSAASKCSETDPADEECCSICIEPLHVSGALKGSMPACQLPCRHTFHRKCITECVKRGHWSCPNCRDDMRERL